MKKIEYLACVDTKKYPGVSNKLNQTIAACRELGHDANLNVIQGGRIGKYICMARNIFSSKADIIIIRNLMLLVMCLPSMVKARAKGKKIIIDIPTPIRTVLNEIEGDKLSFMSLVKSRMHYLLFPVSLWPATKILQYADESWWFCLGINKKIQRVANGISVQAIPIRSVPPTHEHKELVFAAAASLADWHAYDRLIRGMAHYQSQPGHRYRLRFLIAGEGSARKTLEQLVDMLNIRSCVEFVGQKSSESLHDVFSNAHVGVSSLGLYRKKLSSASDLKSREYCARGLPFIAAGDDPDFPDGLRFVKRIPNDASDADVAKIIQWYEQLNFSEATIKEIRGYAEEKLDFKKKMEAILDD